jgi:hypothetical protein
MLYLSAAVHPEGSLRKHALSDLRTLGHAKQPFARLQQAISGLGPLGSVDFKREVEPWVGTEAGLFATSGNALANVAQSIGGALSSGFSPEALLHAGAEGLLGHPDTQAALVFDTRDLEGARAFVHKLASRQGAHHAIYRGVAYNVDAQGQADAIVGKFAVFGDEAGVKEAIDTHLGGASLKSTGTPYATLAAKGAPGTLATVYLDPTFARPAQSGKGKAPAAGEIGQSERAASAEGQVASLLQALPGEPKQARIAIVPQQAAFDIDVDLLASSTQAESKASAAATTAAGLLAGLPGEAWLALGAGEATRHAGADLALLGQVLPLASHSLLGGLGGSQLESLLGGLSRHPAALQRLFAGWAGPAAAFAGGSGLMNLQAGLVIESRSAPRAGAAVGQLASMLSAAGAVVGSASIPGTEAARAVRITGFPVVIDIGAGGGKFVIGLGPASVQSAISPSSMLSSSTLYGSSSSALGGSKPTLLLDFPMVVSLIEGLGLSESPSVAPTLSYLRSLGTLSGATQSLGDRVIRLHAVLGLAGSSGGGEG